MSVYCQGLCPPIFMDYISPIVKDYGRLMKKNMPTYFQDYFRQPSRIMFTYCQVLCTPTVKDYFRIMSRIRSADCQGLYPTTVKDYVCLLSRIMSARFQGLLPPTVNDVRDYVWIIYRLLSRTMVV